MVRQGRSRPNRGGCQRRTPKESLRHPVMVGTGVLEKEPGKLRRRGGGLPILPFANGPGGKGRLAGPSGFGPGLDARGEVEGSRLGPSSPLRATPQGRG